MLLNWRYYIELDRFSLVLSMQRTCAQSFLLLRLEIPLGNRTEMNVHRTFRRSLGRFPNVLCTFNWHPVSRVYLFSTNPCSSVFWYFFFLYIRRSIIFSKIVEEKLDNCIWNKNSVIWEHGNWPTCHNYIIIFEKIWKRWPFILMQHVLILTDISAMFL